MAKEVCMGFLKHAERSALHVSVSQIKTYILCSKKFEYRYVLGADPEHMSPNLLIGSSVHKALEKYYCTVQAGAEVKESDIVQSYSEAFVRGAAEGPGVLLEEGQRLEDVEAVGLGLVRTFLAQAQVPRVEEQLVGYIDAVVKEADGRVVLLEHKTAARAWSQDQLDYDLQVGIYQAATGADAVRLQVLTKTKVPKLMLHDLVRSEQAQVEAVLVVCKVLVAIRAGAFWRNRGWQCKDCEYGQRCGG
jgi:CRISPR/Cas system-associated exonuclease Cas4 (RecB family)